MTSQPSGGNLAEFTTPIERPVIVDDPENANWSDAARSEERRVGKEC